jgi:hypothetical protein
MLTIHQGQNIRQASGEQLLLLAVLGTKETRGRIDRELNRRAVAGTAGKRPQRPGWRSPLSIGAA